MGAGGSTLLTGLNEGAFVLGHTSGHLARTSLPLVQHRPTRRTDLPGAGTVQHAAELDTGEATSSSGLSSSYSIRPQRYIASPPRTSLPA